MCVCVWTGEGYGNYNNRVLNLVIIHECNKTETYRFMLSGLSTLHDTNIKETNESKDSWRMVKKTFKVCFDIL